MMNVELLVHVMVNDVSQPELSEIEMRVPPVSH